MKYFFFNANYNKILFLMQHKFKKILFEFFNFGRFFSFELNYSI